MKVTVVGAGTMGHGIAQASAQAGFNTMLTDTRESALDEAVQRINRNLDGAVERGKLTREAAHAARNRIGIDPDLKYAVKDADLVIEAIVEDLEAKRRLIRSVEANAGREMIFASNTSALSIARLADASARPGRVIGMHFFNPVHIMKLVEIVVHDRTDPAVTNQIRDVSVKMGKQPIIVRDSPGFASSRLGVVLGLEAMRMVEAGVASAEDIDKAMELGYGHPMGPLKVTDLVGLDVRLAIAEHLHRELKESIYRPPEILRRKVAAGELGKKTGKGFYDWAT
jgi:3-hydroxybutyryl-CoA dehydrogenase